MKKSAKMMRTQSNVFFRDRGVRGSVSFKKLFQAESHHILSSIQLVILNPNYIYFTLKLII